MQRIFSAPLREAVDVVIQNNDSEMEKITDGLRWVVELDCFPPAVVAKTHIFPPSSRSLQGCGDPGW